MELYNLKGDYVFFFKYLSIKCRKYKNKNVTLSIYNNRSTKIKIIKFLIFT